MRRREFIAGIGGAAGWPLAAGAQQRGMPVVGFLWEGAPGGIPNQIASFRRGLSEAGFVEGRNVIVEYRWANFDQSRLRELAADLVRRQVDVIATPGSTRATLAVKAETTTIPIVFSCGCDAVQAGVVPSLNRPGSNITGVSTFHSELAAKRLGLLHDLLPGAIRFGLLVPPTDTQSVVVDAQMGAASIGRQIEISAVTTMTEIAAAFEHFEQRGIEGVVVGPGGPLFSTLRMEIVALATRHKIPAVYADRQDAEVGGLMSYGSSVVETYRQHGMYTGRVLKGERPADLPIMRGVKFELVINLKTARLLGLTVPPLLLASADEVIE